MFDDVFANTAPSVRSLDVMSIEELQERIIALEAEIEAAKAMIAQKQASKLAAETFFSKS